MSLLSLANYYLYVTSTSRSFPELLIYVYMKMIPHAGGACGYGEFGRDINDGEVSGVSSRLWKSGAGCGACYQVFIYYLI